MTNPDLIERVADALVKQRFGPEVTVSQLTDWWQKAFREQAQAAVAAYEEWQREGVEAIERIAFEIPAPNPYTPRIVEICQALPLPAPPQESE